jgi:hypothetical protein
MWPLCRKFWQRSHDHVRKLGFVHSERHGRLRTYTVLFDGIAPVPIDQPLGARLVRSD